MSRATAPHMSQLQRRAQELGITLSAMAWRVKHWGLARALATQKYEQPRRTRRVMADAIAHYYATHPDETPPWERD